MTTKILVWYLVTLLVTSTGCLREGDNSHLISRPSPDQCTTQCSPPLLEAPVIGVVAQESPSRFLQYGDQYVFASYVKYLQLAGARVVIVRGHQTDQFYQDMFHMLNGVLLPGGNVDVVTSESTRVAGIFYRMATEAFDRGDYFPVWGTCQGFEQLTVLTAGKNLLCNTDSHNISLSLDLANGWKSSRLLGNAPGDVITILRTENVTANFHDWSIDTQTFYKTKSLAKAYNVLSTNWDRNKKVNFVSTFEGTKYPIYGVQWHPEMNIFAWHKDISVSHSPNAIKVAQYFATFFVDEARKSNHRKATFQQVAERLAENEPVFFIQEEMRQLYAHNLTAT